MPKDVTTTVSRVSTIATAPQTSHPLQWRLPHSRVTDTPLPHSPKKRVSSRQRYSGNQLIGSPSILAAPITTRVSSSCRTGPPADIDLARTLTGEAALSGGTWFPLGLPAINGNAGRDKVLQPQ